MAARARSSFAPWILLAPFGAIFVLFTLYPLARSLVLSCQQTFGPGTAQFVGLENFRAIAGDPLFWTALKNTTFFALGSVFVQLPISLGLALLLERHGLRGKPWFRLILFSPSLVGVVFAAMIFGIIFEKRTGLLNQVLHAAIGFDLDFAWLQDHIMAALIIAALWMYVGFNMVFFSAAIQNVRRELLDSSRIDGAGAASRFLHVILPAIRPVGVFVVLMSIVGSFQLFELPFLMLQSRTGAGNRGLTVVMYLYQTGFETGDLGYASAIGWLLAVILVVCAAVQRRVVGPTEAAA